MSAQGQHNSTVSFQSFHTLVGRQRIPYLKQYESQVIRKFLCAPANNDLMGSLFHASGEHLSNKTDNSTNLRCQTSWWPHLPLLARPGLTQALATYVDWDNWFLDNALRHSNEYIFL